MQTRLVPEIKEIIEKVPFLPTVSIVIPFNPKMSSGVSIRQTLSLVKKRVASLIMDQYNDDLGILVLQKLAKILKSLNTASKYESLAIFLSPVFDKVLYLNFPVKPYISVGDSFSIHQAVYAKKFTIRYLVLNLNESPGKLFYGNTDGIFLIKKNHNAFSAQTYRELKMIMQIYKVPVFILGSTQILEEFNKCIDNDQHIIKHIAYNGSSKPENIFSIISLYFNEWRVIDTLHTFKQMDYAKGNNSLASGMRNVYQAVRIHKPEKLIINKNFLDGFNTIKTAWNLESPEQYHNRFSYVKNNLDEVIEKVLEEGGNVDFLEDNMAGLHHTISLIYK